MDHVCGQCASTELVPNSKFKLKEYFTKNFEVDGIACCWYENVSNLLKFICRKFVAPRQNDSPVKYVITGQFPSTKFNLKESVVIKS